MTEEGYGKQGKTDLAIADYTQAIAINPQDFLDYLNRGDAYNNRGVAYDTQGKTDLAIADYTQAIAVNALNADAYNNRGFAYLLKGNKQQGIKDLEMAKQLYQQQGNTQQQQGNTQQHQKIQEFLNKL